MTESAEVGKILDSFYGNPKSAPPDVKALAAALRKSNESVPGAVFAELLDSRLPQKLAQNWELRPVYVGRYDDELCRVEQERLIDAAMAAEPTVSGAMSAVDDSRHRRLARRSAWRALEKMRRHAEHVVQNKALEASGLDDDTKASIRARWRP